MIESAESSVIGPGTRVRDIHNPSRTGVITNSPPRVRPSGNQWRIVWDDRTVSFEYEGSLDPIISDALADPYELLGRGRFGCADDLRRNLTYVHLSGRLANLVYSMGITNTDFYPHQYKPLLTFLDSPSSGILIADEVGLGKTIEAGLIWTEYRARHDSRRLLVVCPPVLREKWRDELERRFAVKAEIVQGGALLEALRGSDPDREHAWITSYHAIRPPRGWQPGDQRAEGSAGASSVLADYFSDKATSESLFDMVIFDEAHYMRNRDTAAWRLGNLLRDVSQYQVMLSATPINLRNDDLFSLLTLIDPDHFSSLDDLNRLISSNQPLVEARDAVLDLRSRAQDVLTPLDRASQDPWLSQSQQLGKLLSDPPSDKKLADHKYRSETADLLERVNLLSHVVTRTRKRDVDSRRAQREVCREVITMTESERAFYEAVTSAIRRYAFERDVNDGFLLATPQRQLTSSPAALLRAWANTKPDIEDEVALHEEEAASDGYVHRSGPLRNFLISVVPPQVDALELETSDSKLKRLKTVLHRLFKDNPQEKIVLFTSFRTTARYLAERLRASGIESRIVWGDQKKPKHEVIEEFRTDAKIRVLVSTEVAAEGVDLQFCRMLINYDLPWNPTRVEQRIGRIDRLGQNADRIFVWNLFFKDTIDDRIVSRLLKRLRTFEEALGEAEAIVGDTISQLEYELLRRPRTVEEENAEIDRAALALENVARRREELERNAAHMMAHGRRILERIAAAQHLAKFVTDRDLFVFVREYLTRYWPGHEFHAHSDVPMRVDLRLPAALAADFDNYIRRRGAIAQTRLALGTSRVVLFENKIAGASKGNSEVIHQFHPLIGYIAEDLKQRDEHAYPLVGVELENPPASISTGIYAFNIAQWSFSGVQAEEWLAIACANVATGRLLDEEASDMLLQEVRVRGRDWLGAVNEVDRERVKTCLEAAELDIERRHDAVLERKRAENADRAAFQLDSIERHQLRRLTALDLVEDKHRRAGRQALVKATQGQRRVFLEKMAAKREGVRARERIDPAPHFVCAGVLRVGDG